MPVKMSVDDCKLVGGKMVGGKMVGGNFVGGGCGMAWCTDGKWSYSGTKECSKPGPEIQVLMCARARACSHAHTRALACMYAHTNTCSHALGFRD